MFIGAINHKLRNFFWEISPTLDGRDIYVGCSGNFTVEQIISRRCPATRIHSNDIALYSSLVGFALTGREFDIKIKESEYLWLGDYMRRGPDKIASLLLLMEVLKFEKENAFALRMKQHYLMNWQTLFDTTLKKVEKALSSIRIEDYTTVDAHDYFPRPDGVSVGFLPTYVGGYEKLYERIEEIFDYERPAYALLTEERREETVRRMTQGDYILYDDRKRQDLPCVARVDQFGRRAVYIYSSMDFERGLFRRKPAEKVPRFRLLGVDEEIPASAGIKIVKTDNPTIQHYRNLYLKKGIETAAGDMCFLVFVGGGLFGFLIFKSYSKQGKPGEVYLLSDFVAPSRRYPRISKLLLLATLADEMKTLLEEHTISRVKSVYTTAFTDKPVSMKYRGVFELVKRGEGFLNYRGEFQNYALKEALETWKKKYAKR